MSNDRSEYRKQWRLKNLDKIKEQRKEYYQRTKSERQNYDRLYRYGITNETYQKMLENQDFSCKCCGITVEELKKQHPNSKAKTLHIDHCHQTGEVRHLLCNECNTLVGFVEKKLDKLQKALEYVRNFSNKSVTSTSRVSERVSDATKACCSDRVLD